jgi:hypothetical protein
VQTASWLVAPLLFVVGAAALAALSAVRLRLAGVRE